MNMNETNPTVGSDRNASPVIRVMRAAQEGGESPIALWLQHKREGGAPFLDGYVMVGDQKIPVFGSFTKLDKNAADHKYPDYPVIRLRAKKQEESGVLGEVSCWPQNDRKDGQAVNYRTIVAKVGEQTFYATVFDEIGEERLHLGFTGEPRAHQAETASGPESEPVSPRP